MRILLPRQRRQTLPRRAADQQLGIEAARLGRFRLRRRLPGADAARPAAGRPARRTGWAGVRHPPLQLGLPDGQRVGGRDGQSDMHSLMHMGWIPDGAGGYRGQMAVLVKPNGLFGTAYMAAIAPFRHLIVYPPLMRGIGQEWRADTPQDPSPSTWLGNRRGRAGRSRRQGTCARHVAVIIGIQRPGRAGRRSGRGTAAIRHRPRRLR